MRTANMSVQDHSLAYFYGDWTERAKRHVLQAILWKEEQIDLPPRKLGEPWVVTSRGFDTGKESYLAHRHGWEEPVGAESPEELVLAIRGR